MGGKKKLQAEKTEKSIVRSSAAEYLTFVAASGEGGIEAIYADEDIWLTQKMMGELYDVATHTVNYHLKKVFSDSELEEDTVIRKFRITATDGKIYKHKPKPPAPHTSRTTRPIGDCNHPANRSRRELLR
jgi:hypothetical protein